MSPAIDPLLILPVFSYYATHYNGATLHAFAQITGARVHDRMAIQVLHPQIGRDMLNIGYAVGPQLQTGLRKQTPKLYLDRPGSSPSTVP